jgi:hypothetical protein
MNALTLAMMLCGSISKEDYYNIQGAGWGLRKLLQWMRAGKPQSWFK